ncbi:hypothetical protein JTE90_017642 [Oedothorax gibbosus]|uniref:Protein-tyrosine-phosphatase n=1 Tax=Oedothorax gibbosus TaxID=931172 RepID=A0AAV6U9X5_9ARAC|nr:hypothetical protein JTE90_017642 [Oedothorax gibbosus]
MLSELNEVTDHLFISSMRSVNVAALQRKGITCIINCSLLVPNYEIEAFRYVPITIEDNEKADISQFFEEVSCIIHEEHAAGGRTLVYCVAGISRSATLCIAYLMKYQDMTLRNAFRHLRSRRRIIRPNNGFFQKLIEYERHLYNQTTVEMVRVPNADSPDCLVPDVFYEVCKGIVWLRSNKKYFNK